MIESSPRYYRNFTGTYNEQIWDSWLHLVWWVNPPHTAIKNIAEIDLAGWEPL